MAKKLIDGVNIEYEIVGSGKPILALMPGARRGYLEMKSLAEKIAKNDIRILLHDRRNTGKSSMLIDDAYTEEVTWARELRKLFKSLNESDIFISGSSSGARTSLMYALEFPKDLIGLIIMRVTGGTFAASNLPKNYYEVFINAAKSGGMKGVCNTARFAEYIKINPSIENELLQFDVNEFIKNRSKGFAYSPIIASGRNSNVLHYTQNNSKCQSGDLILIDVGAEYGNYASDMTRTIPVSGKFTPRQRAVYDAVQKIGEESMQLLVPGTQIKEYNNEVGKIMTSALIDLGLLNKKDSKIKDKKNPAYKKYFMHGTSHHLGLDTHDYGLIEEPIEPNMVLSVEPGIYIPEEGFGIRIEDNVLVTETGFRNMSKEIIY